MRWQRRVWSRKMGPSTARRVADNYDSASHSVRTGASRNERRMLAVGGFGTALRGIPLESGRQRRRCRRQSRDMDRSGTLDSPAGLEFTRGSELRTRAPGECYILSSPGRRCVGVVGCGKHARPAAGRFFRHRAILRRRRSPSHAVRLVAGQCCRAGRGALLAVVAVHGPGYPTARQR
jgi:hypothetical protein